MHRADLTTFICDDREELARAMVPYYLEAKGVHLPRLAHRPMHTFEVVGIDAYLMRIVFKGKHDATHRFDARLPPFRRGESKGPPGIPRAVGETKGMSLTGGGRKV